MKAAFVFVRAITWASLFVGFVLVYIPSQLQSGGFAAPASTGWQQIVGATLATLGAGIALWCILAFAVIGKGTPAPFDAPRKLVVKGPYRFARNPMYIGAGMALGGAALFYSSPALLGYATFLFFVTHLLVLFYEEPVLLQTFGHEYVTYCSKVKRWGIV